MRAFGFYLGQGTLDGVDVPQNVHIGPPPPVPRNAAPHDKKPLPPIGRANLQDPRNPESVDYQSSGKSQYDYGDPHIGIVDQSAYRYQSYNETLSPVITRSLGRSFMYAIKGAWIHAHGGLGYPADFGFGPGDHKDEMTPQFYMRPGVRPMRQATPTPNNAYKV